MTQLQLAVFTDGGNPDVGARLAQLGANAGFPAFSMAAGSVPVNGTTDATAAFNAYMATIPDLGPGMQFIFLKSGEDVHFTQSVTIPPKVRVLYFGGKFSVANGATLTINSEPGDVDYKIFDEQSATSHVVCGRAMTLQPLWWGGTRDGLSDCSAARDAAHYALSVAGQGGHVHWVAGRWRLDNTMESVGAHFGAQFGTITVSGVGTASILKSGTNYGNAGGTYLGMYTFYGASSPESGWIQRIRFQDIVFEGYDTTTGYDCTTPIIMDGANDMELTNVWFRWFGIECVRGLSGTTVKHFTAMNCHAYKCGQVRGAGVFNVGSQSQTIINCHFNYTSAAIETGNSYTTFANNRAENSVWVWMIGSTWSSWNDPLNGNAVYTARGGNIHDNQYINISDRVGLIPDNKGHANPNYPATSPAYLPGYNGGINNHHNYHESIAIAMWGGADALGEIEFSDNVLRGQWGTINGQTNCLAPTGGIWNVRRNKFRLGSGTQWASLVGAQYVGWNNVPGDRFTFSDNDIYDLCWNQNYMTAVGSQATFARNAFYNVDGLLTGSKILYAQHDPANGSVTVQQITAADFAWWDRDHVFSLIEYQLIPLNSDTIPPFVTFKPGDRLVARSGASTWNGKRCTAGGTYGHTALSATGSASLGSAVMTMSSTTGLSPYTFVSVPTGGVAAKQIKSIDSGTQVTMTTTFEAAVSAAAVSWAVPTFAQW